MSTKQYTDWNNFKIKLLWRTHIKGHICSWVACAAFINWYYENAVLMEDNINMATKSENASYLRSYLAYLDNVSLCRQTSPFVRLYKSSTQTRVTETLKKLPHYKGKFCQFYFFFQFITILCDSFRRGLWMLWIRFTPRTWKSLWVCHSYTDRH